MRGDHPKSKKLHNIEQDPNYTANNKAINTNKNYKIIEYGVNHNGFVIGSDPEQYKE